MSFAVLRPRIRVSSLSESSLNEDIEHFWNMDEASGQRLDAVGTAHWQDVNSVGRTTGKIDFAADIVTPGNKRLDVTGDFWSSGDFTFVGWFNKDVNVTKVLIRCATTNGGAIRSFRVWYNVSQRVFVDVYDSVTGQSSIINDTNLSVFPQWHMAAAGYSTADKKSRVSIDGEDWIVSATPLTNVVRPATFNNIGLDSSSGYTSVISDLYGVWSRLLEDSTGTNELQGLYNLGIGRKYPF